MKITKDSPILTNYLLNEVTQAERQAVEAAVQSDPEVRDALASLKSVIQLAEGLKANHRTERLTQEQREKILSLGEAASDTKRIFSLNWIKWSGGLLTASLALMILTNTKNQLEHKTQSLEVSIPTAEAPADVTTVAKKYATHFKSNASMLSGPSAKGKKEVPAKSEEPDVFAEQSSAKRSAEQRPDLNLRGTSGPDAIAASPADLIAEPSRSSGLKKYLSFGGVGGGSNPAAFSSGKALSKSGAPSAVASPADSAKEREEEIENKQIEEQMKIAEFAVKGPTEIKNYEKLQNSIIYFAYKCFESSLSRYQKYDEEWVLTASNNNGVINWTYVKTKGESAQNFELDLRCVILNLQNFNLIRASQVDTSQNWHLILKSK